jgi:hypothetical protein
MNRSAACCSTIAPTKRLNAGLRLWCDPPVEPQATPAITSKHRALSIIVGQSSWVMPLFFLFLAGCLAAPKKHPWQVSSERSPILLQAGEWPQLSTNFYARVESNKLSEAVALLQDVSSIPIERERAVSFVPKLPPPPEANLHAYLVRGVSYSPYPAWTALRFDAASGGLLVRQATWDGEMMMPVRWKAEPNAFVVFLPRAPTDVYPSAWLGGDLILRLQDRSVVDSR